MGNGTRAQFREQNEKIKIDTHTYTHNKLETSWCGVFVLLVNAAFFLFFCSNSHRIRSNHKKVCHCQHGLRRHTDWSITSTSPAQKRSQGQEVCPKGPRAYTKRWSCCRKPAFRLLQTSRKNRTQSVKVFVPTKQYKEGTDAAFRSRLEKWNSKAGDVLFCLLSAKCGFMWSKGEMVEKQTNAWMFWSFQWKMLTVRQLVGITQCCCL